MNLKFNKERLIDAIENRIDFFQREKTEENNIRIDELNKILYVIEKGCFDTYDFNKAE